MVNKGTTIQGVVAMAIGVMALLIVYVVIPLTGSQLDQAITLPGCPYTVNTTGCAAGAMWNSSTFGQSGLPTAVDTWETLGGIIRVAAIITIIGGFFRSLQGLRG